MMLSNAELITCKAYLFHVGDLVHVGTDTNRVVRRVAEVMNTTSVKCWVYLRPSRGFARHVRRQKQDAGHEPR